MSAGTGNGDTRRVGSMCSGYGGLDLAVERVFGPVRYEWHAENDPAPSKVLDAHWPDVPNLGDLTAVDWSSVEPVDILAAGFPCQPVSSAGQRKGVNDERWLWDGIATAIGRMDTRPRLCVFENVPGLLTANRGHAMARVIRGLAALGYVGRYRTVRASDVGAPHRRERVFIVAHLADTHRYPIRQQPVPVTGSRSAAIPRRSGTGTGVVSLLPTPAARLGDGRGSPDAGTAQRRMCDEGRRSLEDAVALLPTPAARDWKSGESNIMDRNARPLNEVIVNLLPSPRASDGRHGGPSQRSGNGRTDLALPSTVVQHADRWGDYAPAITRWESVTGRPAPDPTEPGTKGQPRLSPRFVEWLMGLPAGLVTNHLPRNAALRVLGNGVVPQQAAAAIEWLVSS